jgi:hypothetical protein
VAKERSTLIDQVNQLYYTANHASVTVGEAEAALLAAQRLAAKYHITPDELATRTGGSAVRWIKIESGLVVNKWRTHLASAIAANFRCSMLQGNEATFSRFTKKPRTQKCLYFLGHDEDVIVAVRSFGYAVQVGDEQLFRYLVEYRAVTPKATQADLDKAREDWSDGFVMGIRVKFKAQTSRKGSSTAVMTVLPDDVAEEAAKFTHEQHTVPNTISQEQLTDHFRDGYETGRTTGDGNVELAEASTLAADLAELRAGHRVR